MPRYPSRAYRPNSARNPGLPSSQGGGNPLAGWLGNPGNQGSPANDNLPIPANDNIAAALEMVLPEIAPRILPRVAARVIPALALAMLAYELSKRFWNPLSPNGENFIYVDPAKWQLDSLCNPNANFGHYTATWPNCAGQYAVNKRNAQNSGPNPATYSIWENTEVAYPPSGFFTYMKPGIRYIKVPGSFTGRINIRNAPYVGFPMVPTPWSPAHPSLNPAAVKPLAPGPGITPSGIPWTALPGVGPNPNAPKSTQRDVGYGTGGNVARDGEPTAHTGTAGEPVGRTAPGHEYRPPPRGTREAKGIVEPGAANLIRRMFDAISEFEDLVDAVYWSISGVKKLPPKWYRDPLGNWHRQNPSLLDKTRFVYDNVSNIDLGRMLQNIAIAQLQDAFWGAIGRAQAKGARNVYEQGIGNPSRTYTLSRRFGSFN